MRYIATLLAAVTIAACQKAPIGQAPVTSAEAEQIAEKAEANFTTGSADNIMAQYADKAVMFDAAAGDPSDDRKVQTAWAKNFNSMKPADYAFHRCLPATAGRIVEDCPRACLEPAADDERQLGVRACRPSGGAGSAGRAAAARNSRHPS